MNPSHLISPAAVDPMSAAVDRAGMIALAPSVEDAERLALRGWEPASVLHVTLFFLGSEVANKEQVFKDRLKAMTGRVASELASFGPITGNLWASSHFNPMGEDPCATYLVGGEEVGLAHNLVLRAVSEFGALSFPDQHTPWVPHLTIGYGLNPSSLRQFGPVTFDRLRFAVGGEVTDFRL